MNIRRIRSCWVYLPLLAGSIFFAFPFLSMLSTSFKEDGELFARESRLLPRPPVPRLVSPYIDNEFYPATLADDARTRELLGKLAELARTHLPAMPPEVDRAAAERLVSRGLFELLARRLPVDVWDAPVSTILSAAHRELPPRTVQEVFSAAYRHLDVASLRFADSELRLHASGSGQTDGWTIGGRAAGSLENQSDGARPVTTVHYDFKNGDTLVVSGVVDVPMQASSIRRLQLDVHPDGTWHELWLRIERADGTAMAREPFVLSGDTWATVTWQSPSEDDRSLTKVRNWILLEDSPQTHPELEPSQVRCVLELRKSSTAGAWAHKLRANYSRAADFMPFWRYVATSFFLVIVNIILTVFASSIVAYSFARLAWPGRDLCFMVMLATMMIPGQVTMVPHFLIWRFLGAYDTLTPLWLGAAFGNAFFIFLLRQFLKTIPRDLEEAARIDGCGFLRIYWHVMLPLIKPSLAAIAIFTFIGTWNDFLGPLLYLADQRLYPLAFGLYAFAVQVNNNPGLTMAGSVMMTLPIIAIFFSAQRYFVEGVTLTGMKG